MNKYKIGIILSSTILFTITSYAATQVQVQGDAPKSVACQKIQAAGQSFSMTLLMPDTQYNSAEIESTQGFTFQHPRGVTLNNEGVKGSCDYYVDPVEITVNGTTRTLQRLVINSVYDADKSACTNVTVNISIEATNASTCDIPMSQ